MDLTLLNPFPCLLFFLWTNCPAAGDMMSFQAIPGAASVECKSRKCPGSPKYQQYTSAFGVS